MTSSIYSQVYSGRALAKPRNHPKTPHLLPFSILAQNYALLVSVSCPVWLGGEAIISEKLKEGRSMTGTISHGIPFQRRL